MKLLEDRKIKIGEREFTVKMSMRAMLAFEKMSGHSVDSIRTLEDANMLFCAAIIGGGTKITFEEYLDIIDENIEALKEFSNWALIGDVEKKHKAR
jgi:hypothetical protein